MNRPCERPIQRMNELYFQRILPNFLVILVSALITQAVKAAAAGVAPGAVPQKVIQFYVAPGGNDAWSGKTAAREGGRTNGPFATLLRARDAIRELKRSQGGVLRQPVTVMVRGGTYFLRQASRISA